MIPSSITLRIAFYVTKRNHTKPLWLISDRSMAAGDNGEALFRHIMSKRDSSIDVRFVLSKKSADYSRISDIGPTVNFGSWRHRLLLLHAKKLISSQADNDTLNPYARQLSRIIDLLGYDFIFLQHGIIRHDLSGWLNRFNRNIALFITSSKIEYQSILDNEYYYTQEQVLLSGLPRYDYLENKPEQKIILAPTYRNNLVTGKANRFGVRGYDSKFKNSDYYKFYDGLMNDRHLLKAMKKNGMTGELYLHPVFEQQRRDFHANELFTVKEYPYEYKKAFREGNLLISDHSSVMFDFAYLKKPVLYAHFDVDTFFDGHSYDKSNFFNDENNGFGEVCYNYESLVKKTIALIESDCKMIKKYQRRVDKYFYKTDRNNSERVLSAIKRMDGMKREG
jgi:CDP-glycerol glycerophosphotransferase (TagB/SpsB family)